MKKIRRFAALVAFAVAAVPCFALSAGAEEIKENISNDSSSVSYSWYWDIDPFLEAEDMNPFFVYQDYTESKYGDYALDIMARYDQELTPVEINGKWGLVDYSGNVVCTPTYEDIKINAKGDIVGILTSIPDKKELLTYSDGNIIASECAFQLGSNGRGERNYYWVPDENSNDLSKGTLYHKVGVQGITEAKVNGTVAAQIAHKIDLGGSDFTVMSDNEKPVNEQEPDIVLIRNGKLLNDTRYTDANSNTAGNNDLLAVRSGDKWGYVNEHGETVIPFEYDSIVPICCRIPTFEDYMHFVPFEASNGFISLCKNGKYSLVDTSGKSVISEGELEKILPVYEKDGKKLAWAKSGGKWGVIAINKHTSTPAVKYAAVDIDKDGSVTSADAIIVLRASIGFEAAKDGDIDRDGTITSADALIVLRQSVGF